VRCVAAGERRDFRRLRRRMCAMLPPAEGVTFAGCAGEH
jgi:hypothetical protein